MSPFGFNGAGVLVAFGVAILGLSYSMKTEVSRHVTIFDVTYDVPETPEVSRVLFPSSLKLRFRFHHGTQTLALVLNSRIRPIQTGCVHPTKKCSPTDVQLVSFYQDVNNGASFQLTCSEELCDTYTLLGTFILKNSMYLMEPTDDSRKYTIKKLSGLSQSKTDYYEQEKSTSAPRRSGRQKRATGRNDVELLFVTDYSVYRFWSDFVRRTGSNSTVEDLINIFYAFVANGVDIRYLGINTEPYSIGVTYVGVYIVKSSADSSWSSYHVRSDDTLDADAALTSFKDWVVANKGILPKHDHAMAFTRYNILKNSGNDIAGYAFQGAICQENSVSVVEESLNFITHTVAAHELGHSLGARHDGAENLCFASNHYIMMATSSAITGNKARNPWQFSSCSKTEMGNLLSSLDSTGTNCLKRRNHDGSSPDLDAYISEQIGQLYSIHQQCAYTMNAATSHACLNNFNNDFSTICTGLWCFNPYSSPASCTLVVPMDYTTCGQGKWCINGECKADTTAPREPEDCLFGDYHNADCSGLSVDPKICYQRERSCCKSCNDINTGISGCEYGDRQDGCKIITSGAPCYDSNTEIQCCQTCANFKTQIPSCKYGDQRNCSALTQPADCYGALSDGNAARTVCCQTCAGYETGRQDCMYGDKVLDCRQSECSAYAAAGALSECCDTCRSYIESTPAPKTNNTALPSWVIPAAAGGGGALVVIIIIIVACCCCRKSPTEKADVKYRPETPKNGQQYRPPLRPPNRTPQTNPIYKSEIRTPKNQEYMGPVSSGGYSHTYERPGMEQQQQTSSSQRHHVPQRQASIDSHVYMELEPDPNVSVTSGYLVSSSSTSDQQFSNPGYMHHS